MHHSRSIFGPLRLSLVIASLLLFALPSQAARVAKVSNGKVLVDGVDSEIVEGQKYFVIVGGKKKAVVQITKVQGGKAVGKVIKGKAEVDGTLQGPGSSQSASSGGGSHGKSGNGPFGDLTIGVLGGYAMDSQTVTSTSTNGATSETVSMSGSGFSVKAFGDLPISGPLGVIGRLGIEQFNVSGSSTRLGDVKTEIMYATADLLVRYYFTEGSFAPFVSGGLGIHFPLSKTSGVLDVQRISSTSVFLINGGFNYAMSDSMYLTALAEYGLFPPSNEVKTSLIAIRGGVGFRF